MDQRNPASTGRSAPADGSFFQDRLRSWLLGGLLAIAVLWTLRAASTVALPLVFALFIALAVLPVHRSVKKRVPDALSWLGYVAALGVVIAFLLLFLGGIGLAARQIAGSAGTILPQVQQRLQGTPFSELLGDQGLSSLLSNVGTYAASIASGLGSTFAALVLIFFFILLMLTEAGDWRAKLEAMSGSGRGRRWAEVAGTIGQRFRRYFLARLMLGVITGVLYGTWLALFGVPLVLVWGILAVLLNFIPTIGSIIAGTLPVLFAFAQQDARTAAIVAVGLIVIEQIMGNYVDPKLMGRQLSLSPLVVLVSLLLWTWVWGLPGALVATPMTMLLVIVLSQLPALKPVALLLSNEREYAGLDEHVTNPER